MVRLLFKNAPYWIDLPQTFQRGLGRTGSLDCRYSKAWVYFTQMIPTIFCQLSSYYSGAPSG